MAIWPRVLVAAMGLSCFQRGRLLLLLDMLKAVTMILRLVGEEYFMFCTTSSPGPFVISSPSKYGKRLWGRGYSLC